MKRALTETTHRIIVESIRRGNTRVDAAAIAGISDRTIRKWVAMGEAEDAEECYESFARDVREAEANVSQKMIDAVFGAAENGDWKAASWYLEKRNPGFKPKQQIEQEVTGKDGGPLGVGVIVLPPEQLDDEDEQGPAGSVAAKQGSAD